MPLVSSSEQNSNNAPVIQYSGCILLDGTRGNCVGDVVGQSFLSPGRYRVDISDGIYKKTVSTYIVISNNIIILFSKGCVFNFYWTNRNSNIILQNARF